MQNPLYEDTYINIYSLSLNLLNITTGPYSKFRVGACLLTHSGEFIQGANVENASFPVGTCAERVAFGTAVVRFSPSIQNLLIINPNAFHSSTVNTPRSPATKISKPSPSLLTSRLPRPRVACVDNSEF